MARRLRPVGLDFVDTAPLRLVFTVEIAAAPEAVFPALAEDVPGWAEWFSAVERAWPTDGGAGREVRLRGGVRLKETILLAKEPELYVYRVDATTAPGLRALAEEWRLTPTATGTRVRWTFAADAPAPLRLTLRLARAGTGRAFRDAMTALERRLTC